MSGSYRNWLCLVTDIEGYSTHRTPEHADAQHRLLRIMTFACRHVGIFRVRSCDRQDRGDGQLYLMSPRLDETLAISRLVIGLRHGLYLANWNPGAFGRIRLRAAMARGMSTYGPTGYFGRAPITAADWSTRRRPRMASRVRSAGIRQKGATLVPVVPVRNGLSQDNRLAVALTRNDAQHAPRVIPPLSPEPSPITMPAQPTLRLADQQKRSLWPLSGVFRPTPKSAQPADLAFIAPDDLYQDVIKPDFPGLFSGDFTRVHVQAKEYSGTAWIYVPESGPALTSNDATTLWDAVALTTVAGGVAAGIFDVLDIGDDALWIAEPDIDDNHSIGGGGGNPLDQKFDSSGAGHADPEDGNHGDHSTPGDNAGSDITDLNGHDDDGLEV